MVFQRWSLVHLTLLAPFASGHTLPLTFLSTAQGFVAQGGNATTVFRAGGLTSFQQGQACRIEFLGRGRHAVPSGVDALAGIVNILGPGSQTGLRTFAGVEYRSLYPGITLRFTADGYRLKSEYVVTPGHTPRSIRLRYADARPEIRLDGSLFVRSGSMNIWESPPVLYQIVDGKRVTVEGAYRLYADGGAGFRAGPYDKSRPLVIDPVLTFSMSLGGSQTDVASGVSQDAAGNLYIAGWTDSTDFSTAVSALPRGRGVDAWIMKLDAATKNLVYLTYLGGNGDDRVLGIAADADGFVYVCGATNSPDFPIQNAAQPAYSAGRDGFVAKLDSTGKKLLYSTYIGGTGDDSANAIAIDGNGAAYVTGETDSTDLATRTPLQAARAGGHDVFVAAFGRSGTLQYATYLGGSGDDRGLGIAVDINGNAYVTGSTQSANFPVLGPFQTTKAGGLQDAFVSKLNPQGTALVYSTYLGGSGGSVIFPEQGNGIAVDGVGSAYIVGTTSSADFPRLAPLQSAYLGTDADAFVTKLDPTGSKLVYSTYLGGIGVDVATAVRVDPGGNAFVVGYTSSPDFPNVQGVGVPSGLYDAFLVEIGSTGGALLFATVVGGQQSDTVSSLSGINETVIVGSTNSADRFPGTIGINALVFGVQIAPVAPFGFVDTPQNNAVNLNGAVGITGWAIDQDQVPLVEIWRDPVTGEPPSANGLVLIGDAVFVPGARPDVAAILPGYPYRDRAGWGLQVLTNLLPNADGTGSPGNGTYKFHIFTQNRQGRAAEIGVKSVTVDNVDSVLPFGTIDTPGPGGTISGSAYVNFGWVLAPQPFNIPVDGSSIVVYIDGKPLGHPVYNNFRADIAGLFPGRNNTNGAVGYFIIDTTGLTNGIHDIVWGVLDNAGHAQGIGGRNFFVQN